MMKNTFQSKDSIIKFIQDNNLLRNIDKDLFQLPLKKGKIPIQKVHGKSIIKDQNLNMLPTPFNTQQQRKDPLQQQRRIRIADTSQYPYCCVGLLSIGFKMNTYFGTGFLIHDNIVLTCAHNLFNRLKKKQAQTVLFYPGLNGNKGQCFQGLRWFVPEEFKFESYQNSCKYDFAIIILNAINTQKVYGSIGYNLSYQKKDLQKCQIIGYPYDLSCKIDLLEIRKYQFADNGSIQIQDDLLYYQIHTSYGQSGSPILMKINQTLYFIGIHTRFCQKKKKKSGSLINYKVVQTINQWLKDYFLILNLENNQTRQDTSFNLTQNYLNELVSKEWPEVYHLNLENQNLTQLPVQKLFSKAHLLFFNLKQLNLAFCNLKSIKVQCLIKHLKYFNSLTHLNLTGNLLCCQGISMLGCNKQVLPQLLYLNIMINNIKNQGLHKFISNETIFPKLEELNLNHNKLAYQLYQVFLQFPNTFKNLKYLHLNQNKIKTDKKLCVKQLLSKRFKYAKIFL